MIKHTSYIITILLLLSGFAELPAQNTVGLIQNSELSSQGYTLFTPNKSTSTYLIDNEGRLVREWVSDYRPTLSVYLLENGNLLRSAALTAPGETQKGGFQLYSWEGELLWEYYSGPQHHDIEPLPNGNVLLINNDERSIEEATLAGRDSSLTEGPTIRSLCLLEVEQAGPDSGFIVWKWQAWDHLIQDFDSTRDNYGSISDHPELIDLNYVKPGGGSWLHTNAVDYHAGLDQIVISNRAWNELWIIDHSTSTEEAAGSSGGNSGKGGDLLYRWGNPRTYAHGDTTDQQLFAQHDARWIDEGFPGAGNITIFSNGEGRPAGEFASVEEIITPGIQAGTYPYELGSPFAPAAPTWTYIDEVPLSFQASRFGGAHRLENGNTLICSPLEGRIFEVSPELDIVWEYINPVSENGILYQGDTPSFNTMYRAERYELDYPGFDGRDLTPGDPIELYPNSVREDMNLPEESRLLAAYPNPFNPLTHIRYELSRPHFVELKIFDLKGQEVAQLVQNRQSPGAYQVSWDGVNVHGQPMGSGIYLIILTMGQDTQVQRVTLLR